MGATGRDLHVNVPLTNIAIEYRPSGMIADLIAPVVPVLKQSDSFPIWSIADAYRIEDTLRAPGTRANRITRSVSSDTYYAKNWALEMSIPDEDVANADAAYLFGIREGRVQHIKSKLMLDWENRLATYICNTSNVGSSSKVSSGWSAKAAGNSDPITDIQTAVTNITDAWGVVPNRIIIGVAAWRNLQHNENAINRLYGTAGGGGNAAPRIFGVEGLKSLFGFDDVLIGSALYNTAQEGQTASLTPIWGDDVLVYYAPPQPSRDNPSFMYSFRWNGDGSGYDMVARNWREEPTKSEYVDVQYYQGEKITASGLGFLLCSVNSH